MFPRYTETYTIPALTGVDVEGLLQRASSRIPSLCDVKFSGPRLHDAEHGEWFGYLDRQGRVTHRFKGGPYKGCFHVLRALWGCWRLLQELEAVRFRS